MNANEQVNDPNVTSGMFAQFIDFVLQVPALSLTVFLRRGLGYRIVRGRQIAASFIVIFLIVMFAATINNVIAIVSPSTSVGGGTLLLLLALAFVPLAIRHNRRDWERILRGEDGSTWNRGIPRLAEFIPIRADLIARFVEPALCVMVGFLFVWSMPLLGLWLIMAGLFIGLHEAIARERYLEAFLNGLDNGYFAKRLNEDMEAVKSGGAAAANGGPAAYDGVVPALPPHMARKMREREKMWKAGEGSSAQTPAA